MHRAVVARGLTYKVPASEAMMGDKVRGDWKQHLGKAEQHHSGLQRGLYNEAEDGVTKQSYVGVCVGNEGSPKGVNRKMILSSLPLAQSPPCLFHF